MARPNATLKRKAFQVTRDDEGEAIIVWDTSSAAARRRGMGEWGVEFNEVSTKRLPELDDFKGNGHDLLVWQMAHGWWMECHAPRCSRHCYGETDGDEEPIVIDDGDVYCSTKCQAAHAEERAWWDALDFITRLRVEQVLPGAVVHDVYRNEYEVVDVTRPDGRRTVTSVDKLTEPDLQVWRLEPEGVLVVARIEEEAWEAVLDHLAESRTPEELEDLVLLKSLKPLRWDYQLEIEKRDGSKSETRRCVEWAIINGPGFLCEEN